MFMLFHFEEKGR